MSLVHCANSEDVRRVLAELECRAVNESVVIELAAGCHRIGQTLSLRRSHLTLRGVGTGETLIERGFGPDGRLFNGPLLLLTEACDLRVEHLSIQGARFDWDESGHARRDLRHPYSADVFDPAYVKRCEADGRLPEGLHAYYEADVLIMACQRVSLERLHLLNAVENAVAVSRNCADVSFHQVRFERAGQFGLWMGAALSGPAPALPLPDQVKAMLPSQVRVDACTFERCGASAMFVEAQKVTVTDTQFDTNHCDYPFQESGGQITLDYKSCELRFASCRIHGAAPMQSLDGRTLLSAVGFESSACDVELTAVTVSGQVREGIHFDGSAYIRLVQCHISGNNTGRSKFEALALQPRHNVSITTSAACRSLGQSAQDYLFDRCEIEGGVIIWCSDPYLQPQIKRMTVVDYPASETAVKVDRNMLGLTLVDQVVRLNVTRP